MTRNGKELWEAALTPQSVVNGVTIVAATGVDLGLDSGGNVYVLSSVRENPIPATRRGVGPPRRRSQTPS